MDSYYNRSSVHNNLWYFILLYFQLVHKLNRKNRREKKSLRTLKMKLFCNSCNTDTEIIVQLSGPHKKAICSRCKKYIKFLSKLEMKELEDEEDSKEVN